MNKNKYQNSIKISQIINSTTKMDTVLIDQDGNVLFKLINYPVPSVLAPLDYEYKQIKERFSKKPSNYHLHYTNSYGLEYIAAGIWNSKCFLVVGPFISSLFIIDGIKDIISRNNLPVDERNQLEQFYQSLPVLNEIEYKNLGKLLVNMCNHDYVRSKLITFEALKPLLNPDHLKESVEENKDIIESRYKTENKLMDAIARGDKAEVNDLINTISGITEFSNRIPESPIRSSKNMAFVMNTLSRIAAERGGIHPVYLHSLSERFAILIERTTNISNLKKLIVLMVNEYCDLVNNYATGHYSSIVKKAVDYIMLHSGNTLTLNRIAEEIHVNPSYLSRKFREETGMNLSEFINQRRIDEAKLYLRRGNISITEVAFLVGFNDLNYFSKVFKKLARVTPSQYAKKKNW